MGATPLFAAKPLGSGFSLFRAPFGAHHYRSARNSPSSVPLSIKRKVQKQKAWFLPLQGFIRNRAHSPLFLKAASMRQIGCAFSKCDFETRSKIISIITRAREIASIITRAREIAIFRSATQFGNTLPFAGKVKLRHFYKGVPQIRGYPENRRATPEIFGEEEKQYCGACGLPLGKSLQRECCFDEAATRKTSAVSNKVRAVGLSSNSQDFAGSSLPRNPREKSIARAKIALFASALNLPKTFGF